MQAINDTKKFMAQGFAIATPSGVTGIYATKIGLFFKKKPTDASVQVNIVELSNGIPDEKLVVPGSFATKASSSIGVSATAATETIFQFDTPIFLDTKKKYAFTVSSTSADFEIWSGQLGERDVTTGKTVAANPLSELSYVAENSSTWSTNTNRDLKFKLYRAKFNTTNAATVKFKTKQNLDFMKLSDVASEAILPLDEVYMTDVDGMIDTSNLGKVVEYNPREKVLTVDVVRGSFSANSTVRVIRTTQTDNVANSGIVMTATLDSLLNFKYNSILPRLSVDGKLSSAHSIKFKGVTRNANTSSFVLDSTLMSVPLTEAKQFSDSSRYLMSYSNEVSQISGNSSITIEASFETTNDFIAPVVDLRNSAVMLISNDINSDATNETGAYGNACCRYISKIITLAEGMDAEDMRVFINAYKPVNTDVKIYSKMVSASDPGEFDDHLWTELEQATETTVFSDPKNQSDYREYEFTIPSVNLSNGVFAYTTSAGKFETYLKFSMKVVLLASAGFEHNPPKISDLRVLCLQK